MVPDPLIILTKADLNPNDDFLTGTQVLFPSYQEW